MAQRKTSQFDPTRTRTDMRKVLACPKAVDWLQRVAGYASDTDIQTGIFEIMGESINRRFAEKLLVHFGGVVGKKAKETVERRAALNQRLLVGRIQQLLKDGWYEEDIPIKLGITNRHYKKLKRLYRLK